jgi:predicted acetyltransferase
MDVEIRTLREGELEAVLRANAAWFGEGFSATAAQAERPTVEPDRYFVAIDGEQIVAGAGAATFQLTVPGDVTVPCAGLTAVGTLPTHRRRGLSTALMKRQLEQAREHGDPVSYLWASEAVIYQRFGFGLGAWAGAFRIRRHATGFLREVEPSGRLRLVDRDEGLKVIPDVYDRVRRTRPGAIDRSAAWLDYRFRSNDEQRDKESSPSFFAISETSNGVEGYVSYSIKDLWEHGGPNQELEIEELVAATGRAYAALWRYCFDIDLVRTVTGWKRPSDEPLLNMLAEPRALNFKLRDGTWVRLVDVPAALEARRYSHEGRLILEVDDGFAPWNDGTYELEGGPDGATCRPSSAEPDLSMRVEDLGATYLGTVTFRALAAAGRVIERKPGALKTADSMFSSAVAPWCPWIF